jgi:H+/Cl- antiporter ClcA
MSGPAAILTEPEQTADKRRRDARSASPTRSQQVPYIMSVAPQPHDIAEDLADFTATRRLLTISAFAIGIGIVSAYVALALLKLIGFFTNIFFFQRLSTALITPETHALGPFVILVPVVGALAIGVMARYDSERIRGHGIPEAIEAILINGSRVEPKVALPKPLSSAISIGSGGPFGAEGPITMRPWCLLAGLLAGLCIGFYELACVFRRRRPE